MRFSFAALLVAAAAFADAPRQLDEISKSLDKADAALAAGNATNASVYLSNARRDFDFIDTTPSMRGVKSDPGFEPLRARIAALPAKIDAATGLSEGCRNTSEFALGIIEREYGVYQASGAGKVRARDLRTELERARYTLYQTPENKSLALPRICDEGDRRRPEFAALERRFKAAEKIVAEVESKKHVHWAGFTRSSGLTWVDDAGREIPNSEEVF